MRFSRSWAVWAAALSLVGCEQPIFLPVDALEPPTDTCPDVPAPRDVRVRPADVGSGWRVAWSPPEGGLDVSYAVEVSVDDGGFARLIAGVAETAYLDSREQPADRELTYRVVAEAAGCASAPSGEVAVLTAPRPVVDAFATPAPDGVVLSWTDENEYGGSTVVVEVGPKGGDLAPTTCASSTAESCRLELPFDAEREARIVLERIPVSDPPDPQATDLPPFRAVSALISFATPPLPVTITSTAVDDDRIDVTFSSENVNHSGYVATLLELPAYAATLPKTATSYSFTGLPMDTELTVVVAAHRDGVTGPEASVVVRTTCREEALPTALRAEGGFLGTAPYIDVFLSRTDTPIEPQGFVYEVERCQGTASSCESGPGSA